MDYFGLNSTADLPKISEVLMEEFMQATAVKHVEIEENNAVIEPSTPNAQAINIEEVANQDMPANTVQTITANTDGASENVDS
jgi:hypothetical protein